MLGSLRELVHDDGKEVQAKWHLSILNTSSFLFVGRAVHGIFVRIDGDNDVQTWGRYHGPCRMLLQHKVETRVQSLYTHTTGHFYQG
jgi:hypothetical protein